MGYNDISIIKNSIKNNNSLLIFNFLLKIYIAALTRALLNLQYSFFVFDKYVYSVQLRNTHAN